MIKCCIFDLDGTILDTIGTITYFVNSAITPYGVAPITVEECKYFAGNGARKLITRAIVSRGITDALLTEKILGEYNAAYDADPLYMTGVFEGIPEALALLKEYGVKLAVLSNKPDPTVKQIVEGFFPGIFDIALGGREGVPLKPDPTAALDIISALGFAPDECAWVGDTSTDIETGKNLGARVSVGVLWGFRKRDELVGAGADVVISSASELTEALGIG
jgi:phosphoglycolate phosphatase